MNTTSLQYPGMRFRLISCLEDLSNKQKQTKDWVKISVPHFFWDNLSEDVAIIFDEFSLDSNPEKALGSILRDNKEIETINPVVNSLNRVLNKIGIEQPDSAYLNSPLWDDVVEAAKHAYAVLMKDEDLDALLKVEEDRLAGV